MEILKMPLIDQGIESRFKMFGLRTYSLSQCGVISLPNLLYILPSIENYSNVIKFSDIHKFKDLLCL